MKLKIYIFRHGQTYFNREHKFTGWKDSKLTPKGVKDAKKVAKKLKNKKIDIAYRSRLTRSKHTLKEVLNFHPECKKIIVDDRIIERCYGKLQGMSHKAFVKKDGTEDYKLLLQYHKLEGYLKGKEKEEFIQKIGQAELKIIRRSYSIPPPGGESVKDVEKRVNSLIEDLLKMMKKEKVNVAISAHGNSMRPFRKHFEKLTVHQMMKLENPWDDYFEYTIKI